MMVEALIALALVFLAGVQFGWAIAQRHYHRQILKMSAEQDAFYQRIERQVFGANPWRSR